MLLSLKDAAARLGKSVRQVRYLLKQGKIAATQVAGRWLVELDDVPKSDGQARAAARKQERLRSAIERGLGVDADAALPPRYSVRDLKAFQLALPLYQRATTALGTSHAATLSLRQVLFALSRGCHRYEHSAKADAYRAARDGASEALCELLLAAHAEAPTIAHAVEQELMPAFAGLLRRVDRRARL